MAKPKNKLQQHLSKFAEAIPNRAKLAYESLFAPSEAERRAANELLKLLPKETRTVDAQIQWQTDIWLKAPSAEELALSPAGRKILEMVADSKPVGDGVTLTDSISAPASPATESQVVANAAMPAIEDDGVNDYLRKLDWPPQPQKPTPKVEEDETPHKWQAAHPSKPDKSLKPLAPSDWDSDSRETLY